MTHDLNDTDAHLSDYHKQLFSRATRYYDDLAAGARHRKRRRTSWPVVAAFTLGALLSFLLATLVLPTPAAALPENLSAAVRPVAAAAPSKELAEVSTYKTQLAQSQARAAARAYEARLARQHELAVLASEDANPLRGVSGLVAERVDMGVDYAGTGPVYAVGPGIIQNTYNSGWPGGAFVCEYLTGGRWAGNSVYVAEDAVADVGIGQQVYATTVIATMQGGIETGWAQGGCAGNALAGGYPGWPTADGISYNQVLVSLGAPSGTGVTGAGPMDQGKPTGTSHGRRCGWRCYPRNRAMDWALRQAGCAYTWGGTSCAQGFDCSGLVTMAYRHAGFDLPRTTYDILADVGVHHYRRHIWWALMPVSHPRRGDLAFYGSGHVELMTKLRHETFGAHDYGSPVSYIHWGYGWQPTAFYRVEVHQRR